ncbi:MAG: AbrB/MazE/SpoVT family DNA-binding domain-containing protein [Gammaproteobacteria bacterium]|nr:AbrB/MazE/SpoVT family DNA-binding domain-containing protein [Gammaproteobacteria bacterium]MYG96069.1 AbrB/MazE/SpoVT family DNA-binding domain-containing protein [Gammaproteobacteria bacterium]
MTTVTVSPKFQIVIPKEIRDANGIVAGQKMQMISFRGGIQLVPVQAIEKLRGTLEGIDTYIEREAD